MECAPIINFLQADKSKQLLSLIRKCKQPVVFTSGVFDLLHVGHLEYLREAKRYGKSLIVGVNTDNSAKKLEKGPSRPFNNENDRASLIASLRYVDGVILFNEDTPNALIKLIKPSFFVKGGDYSETSLRATDLSGLKNTELKIIPLKTNYSSTRLIKKIIQAHQ